MYHLVQCIQFQDRSLIRIPEDILVLRYVPLHRKLSPVIQAVLHLTQ